MITLHRLLQNWNEKEIYDLFNLPSSAGSSEREKKKQKLENLCKIIKTAIN